MSIVIGVRNALAQWEKLFLNRHFYHLHLYQETFKDLQLYLQKTAQKIRWYRHSDGTLCHLKERLSSCFFESISSSEVDRALSQIESTPTCPFIGEMSSLLKWTNKESTLFINLENKKSYPLKITEYGKNELVQVMNFEWSVQTHPLINESSLASFRKNHQEGSTKKISEEELVNRAFFSYKTEDKEEELLFTGEVSDRRSYLVRRTLSLSKSDNLLKGQDVFFVHEFSQEPLAVLRFSLDKDLQILETLPNRISFHYPTGRKKQIQKGKSRRKICQAGIFEIESELPFFIKIQKKGGQAQLLTAVCSISNETSSRIQWSFQLNP
jgi:hypothetical protein